VPLWFLLPCASPAKGGGFNATCGAHRASLRVLHEGTVADISGITKQWQKSRQSHRRTRCGKLTLCRVPYRHQFSCHKRALEMPMPEWVLGCQHCRKVFTHSKISPRPATTPYDPLWPTKPDFPDGGMNLACPTCKTPATYQRFELMYRPD